MEQSNKKMWIIVTLLILVIFGGCIYYYNTLPREVNWSRSFEDDNTDPYNTFGLFNLFESSDDFQQEVLSKPTAEAIGEMKDGNYFFIGRGYYIDSLAIANLIQYVKKGNNAFIASRSIPDELMEYLYYDDCGEQEWQGHFFAKDSSTAITFPKSEDTLQADFIYDFKPTITKWYYAPDEYFCGNSNQFNALAYSELPIEQTRDSIIEWYDADEEEYEDEDSITGGFDSIEPIDNDDYEEDYDDYDELIEEYSTEEVLDTVKYQKVNFYEIKYGKGSFYIHTQPRLFTNYYLRDSSHFNYIEHCLNYLTPGPLYWDKDSRVFEYQSKNNPWNENLSLKDETLLKYILNNRSLRSALYVFLAVCLLFLLFRTKRTQRPIPVQRVNENTTMEHSMHIANLFYKQKSKTRLTKKMAQHLCLFIREKYNIPFNEQTIITDTIVQRLSKKSGLPETYIKELLYSTQTIITARVVTENTMLEYYKKSYTFKHTSINN